MELGITYSGYDTPGKMWVRTRPKGRGLRRNLDHVPTKGTARCCAVCGIRHRGGGRGSGYDRNGETERRGLKPGGNLPMSICVAGIEQSTLCGFRAPHHLDAAPVIEVCNTCLQAL
jgi:hypothetical protein